MTLVQTLKKNRVFDFSEKTRRELIFIATDPVERMGNRVDAVNELKKRRKLKNNG